MMKKGGLMKKKAKINEKLKKINKFCVFEGTNWKNVEKVGK
jgi:hypothetical protein